MGRAKQSRPLGGRASRSQSRFACRRARLQRRGAVALIVALLLPVFMVMVALSADIGNLYRVDTEGQRAVDSAALAGAGALNGTTNNMLLAAQRAEALGEAHFAYADAVELEASDIEIGFWNTTDRTFTTPVMDPLLANAVRVTHLEAAVSTPFAAVNGNSQSAVTNSAIALGGGPVLSDCAFPLVVADCALADAAANQNCEMCVSLQSANDDNAAWTSFGANGNGLPQIAAAIDAACFDSAGDPSIDATTGECVPTGTGCSQTEVTEAIDLNGGSIMNSSANGFCVKIVELLERNGPGTVTPFTVEAPVVQTGLSGANCGTASLNGNDVPVAGHVKMDIFGVRCGAAQNAPMAVATTAPNGSTLVECQAPPSGQFLLAALRRVNGQCDDTPVDAPAGGSFFGTLGRPRLVD